jgi:hypothetical protein
MAGVFKPRAGFAFVWIYYYETLANTNLFSMDLVSFDFVWSFHSFINFQFKKDNFWLISFLLSLIIIGLRFYLLQGKIVEICLGKVLLYSCWNRTAKSMNSGWRNSVSD